MNNTVYDMFNGPIERFYSMIRNKKPGSDNSRYRSWELCHRAFYKNRKQRNDDICDYLALHLGFYLASWGMYRGSSFLLQRDYTTHKDVVCMILEPQYESLWKYDPNVTKDSEEIIKLLFGNGTSRKTETKDIKEDSGIYWRIVNCYGNNVSDTLVTKILMGTFACIPAFDRFLKSGIRWFNEHCGDFDLAGVGRLTQNIEDHGNNYQALINIARIIKNNLHADESKINYPPMKLVDMFFWEIGYELDILEGLEKAENDNKILKYKKLISLIGICNENDPKDDVIKKIKGNLKV